MINNYIQIVEVFMHPSYPKPYPAFGCDFASSAAEAIYKDLIPLVRQHFLQKDSTYKFLDL